MYVDESKKPCERGLLPGLLGSSSRQKVFELSHTSLINTTEENYTLSPALLLGVVVRSANIPCIIVAQNVSML